MTNWEERMQNAAKRIGVITEHPAPTTEHGVKEHAAYALCHGTYAEAAEVLLEAAEWQAAHLMNMAEDPTAT